MIYNAIFDMIFDRYEDDVYIPNIYKMSGKRFKKYICDLYIMFNKLTKDDYLKATIYFYNAPHNTIPDEIKGVIIGRPEIYVDELVHHDRDIERLSTALLIFGSYHLDVDLYGYIIKDNWMWRKWMLGIIYKWLEDPIYVMDRGWNKAALKYKMKNLTSHDVMMLTHIVKIALSGNTDENNGAMELIFIDKAFSNLMFSTHIKNNVVIRRILLQYLWRGRKSPESIDYPHPDSDLLYLLGASPAPKNIRELVTHERRMIPFKIHSRYQDLEIICADVSYR